MCSASWSSAHKGCSGFISWALASGIIVSCGCFGADEAPSAGKMIFAILRDGFILSSALAILFLPRFSNRESTALANLK
jgi:F0F1-type ATP synthase membrane subunit c/vacuolar-type H+-ATPase subunit K